MFFVSGGGAKFEVEGVIPRIHSQPSAKWINQGFLQYVDSQITTVTRVWRVFFVRWKELLWEREAKFRGAVWEEGTSGLEAIELRNF